MKSKLKVAYEKLNDRQFKLLIWSIAACLIVFTACLSWIYYDSMIYYDSSAEMALNQYLAEHHTLVAKDWLYGNELRIVDRQIIPTLLFMITSNWRVVNVGSVILHLLLFFCAFLFFMKSLFGTDSRKAYAVSLIVLLPWTDVYVQFILNYPFYVVQFCLVFLELGLYLRRRQVEGKIRSRYLLIEEIVAFAAALSSIKNVEEIYVPLFAAVLMFYFIMDQDADKQRAKQELREWLFIFESIFVGFVLNLCAKSIFHFWGGIGYGTPGLTGPTGILLHLEYLLRSVLQLFGFYYYETSLTSVLGIRTVLSAVVIVMAIRSAEMMKIYFSRFSDTEKIAVLFTGILWAENILLMFSVITASARYLLLSFIMLIVCIVLLLSHIRKDEYQMFYRIFYGTCAVIFVLSGFVKWNAAKPLDYYYNIPSVDWSAEMLDAEQYLTENGYTFGYSDFYDGASLEQASDGQIEMFFVEDYETLGADFVWFCSKEAYDRSITSEERVFLMMNMARFVEFQDLSYVQAGDIVYHNDGYVIISYEDNQDLQKFIPDDGCFTEW